ncbi:hypothetical protein LCGC14_0516520 [marine sediment metagenome]|uniref:Uncharacterized protein n=1 Tax=marine sediment metagenome TaxID=412755 RepID=A0A0F9S4I7_9ZZZZ
MSLQDIYNATYAGGESASGESEKTADDKAVEEALAKFDEDQCAKLAATATLMDTFGMEFKSGAEKIAAACNLIDHLSEDDGETATSEKTASDDEAQAKELDAAGRIMAQGFMAELDDAEKTASEKPPAGSFATILGS